MSYGHGSFAPPQHMSMPSGSFSGAGDTPEWLERLQRFSSQAEDMIDTYTQPVKPYLPALGRFLIVVTFIEDAVRIITQWNDQASYLNRYRGIPMIITQLFLIVNVIVRDGARDATDASSCSARRRW